MIPTGHTKELDEPMAAIERQVQRAADYDDPRTTSNSTTRSPNPHESKQPGSEQAKRLVADVSKVLERTARDLKTLCDNANIRDRQDSPHQTIGGVDVAAPEVEGTAYRPHKRKVSIVVVQNHLSAKVQGIIDA